jgi:hypothetical protein|tara:strand:- start:2134 stop:2418 length:285 start_codon:yes stop_codon:yes gene_type:complete
MRFAELDKRTIRKAHKTADKILDKPKAKKSIAKWAKEKGMDPEGAIYAIATNMAKKKKGESVEEKWTRKYKRSINCNNPKGFSQKAHCAGRNKK